MSIKTKDSRTGTLFDLGPQVVPEPLVRRTRPVYTEHKAKLVARYLYYFVMITKNGAYLDGFSGPQSESDDESDWSARLVLESRPRWLRKFFLFEQDPEQVARLRSLRDAQPPRTSDEPRRTVEIIEGDFNERLPPFLATLPIKPNEAAFALLDQRTFECRWRSVVALAQYKPVGKEKIELFYFLPNWWLNRAIAATKDEDVIRDWWGEASLPNLRKIRQHERASLMSDRLRVELGYKSAKPWPIWQRSNAGGGIMYYMIHATDHPEAPKLMDRAYRKVLDPPEPLEQLKLWLDGTPSKPSP